MKKKILLIVSLLLLTVSSCHPIQARPEMESLIRSQADVIAELDRRCQGGDADACDKCSAVSNATFVQLVNALDGKAGD